MSSFTISKSDYIKAAGIVAGIAEASGRGNGCRQVWLYDYETGRNSTPEDYYRRFTECFEMNALSVQEQYHDSTPELDSGEYKAEFKAALQTGKRLYFEQGEKLKNAIMELRQFFNSAIYQTEKQAYMFKMQMFFNQILSQLMVYLWTYEPESWGDLKITA